MALLVAAIAFGLCLPVVVALAAAAGLLGRAQLSLFGIGVALGLVWEFALVVVVPPLLEPPLYTVFQEVPVPQLVHVAAFSSVQVHDRVRASSDGTYLTIHSVDGSWTFEST